MAGKKSLLSPRLTLFFSEFSGKDTCGRLVQRLVLLGSLEEDHEIVLDSETTSVSGMHRKESNDVLMESQNRFCSTSKPSETQL